MKNLLKATSFAVTFFVSIYVPSTSRAYVLGSCPTPSEGVKISIERYSATRTYPATDSGFTACSAADLAFLIGRLKLDFCSSNPKSTLYKISFITPPGTNVYSPIVGGKCSAEPIWK